jgi:hypothetical protein
MIMNASVGLAYHDGYEWSTSRQTDVGKPESQFMIYLLYRTPDIEAAVSSMYQDLTVLHGGRCSNFLLVGVTCCGEQTTQKSSKTIIGL